MMAAIPTLFGITLLSFVIINLAPGGPIEQRLHLIRTSGGAGQVSEKVIHDLKKQYGFDQPLLKRYGIWLNHLVHLNFGQSFSYEEPVLDLILRKLPATLQFGVVSFILTYLICIPLGVMKAVHSGQAFDRVSSIILNLAYAIPPFMLAIVLIVAFGGGSFWNLFPMNGMTSESYAELSMAGKVADRVHHFILPLICYVVGQFTALTALMKSSMTAELQKDYIRTARAKGLSETIVIFKHALRNALIPMVTGFGHILTVFFAGSILLETIFSLDGIGLLGYTSVLARDYNVTMGLLVLQSLFFLVGNLVSDLMYVGLDPRIDLT